MHIEPSNPIIKRFLQNFLTKDELAPEYCYDYDNVIYQVSSDPEVERVIFSCKTNCSKEVFKHGGDEMIQEVYPDYVCPKEEYTEGFDVTLHIPTGNLPQTKKIKKSMDEET